MGTVTALNFKQNNDEIIINRWIEQFESKDTVRKYKFQASTFFNVKKFEHIANKMIKNTTYIDAERYIKKLTESGKERSTLKNAVASLRSLFSYAVNDELISKNPFEDKRLANIIKLKTPNNNDKIVGRALTTEEIAQLIEVINNQRDKLMILFALRTGVRVNELTNIKYSNFIYIESKDCWFVGIYGKGRKYRQIFVKKEMIDELIEYAEKNNNILGISDEVVFNMSTGNANRIVEKWGKKSGILCTPHDFRRSFATYLLNKGVSIYKIQKALGHSNSQTTMKYARENDLINETAGEFIDY